MTEKIEKDFSALSLDDMGDVIARLTSIRDELMAELNKYGGIPSSQPKRSATDGRSSPKPMYRSPSGDEWSGRGALPKWAKALGVADKAGMEKYRIKS